MGGGRKNLKRTPSKNEGLTLLEGQCVMQVLSLRGSNIIEVTDAEGVKSLALFPARFQKSIWIKKGSFVVVDETAREKALESGSKIACMVSQVLFHDQVRALQKSPEWPEAFKATLGVDSNANQQRLLERLHGDSGSDEDDELPPEENSNRNRPVEVHSDSNTDTDSS